MICSNKVVIVGAGNVGSMCAYTLLNQGLCREIVLIDMNMDKAVGEAMDMEHASKFMSRRAKVRAGGYEDCEDADILIITASAPVDKNLTSRLDILAPSKRIMKSIIGSVKEHHFHGIMIVISNPVDVMSYYAWKLSGLPRNHVIGSGTTLDSTRLEYTISEIFDVDPKSVFAPVIGEHGANSVPVFSQATVGGENILNIVKNHPEMMKGKTLKGLLQDTLDGGFEIMHRKGNTCYGIASSVTSIVKAILADEDRVLSVSTFLQGEYGVKDLFLSTPCVLNKDGIRNAIELSLLEEEKEYFLQGARNVRSYYQFLDE